MPTKRPSPGALAEASRRLDQLNETQQQIERQAALREVDDELRRLIVSQGRHLADLAHELAGLQQEHADTRDRVNMLSSTVEQFAIALGLDDPEGLGERRVIPPFTVLGQFLLLSVRMDNIEAMMQPGGLAKMIMAEMKIKD